MVRTPIGGSDFSTHRYAYNERPTNDVKLKNFSLTYEDYTYKVKYYFKLRFINKFTATKISVFRNTTVLQNSPTRAKRIIHILSTKVTNLESPFFLLGFYRYINITTKKKHGN
jgi:hypothetical protein